MHEMKRTELNVVFSVQFCILLRGLYYVHMEYEMLFETCTARLGVTEESSALLLLLYYIILCVGRAVVVVIVTVHVRCTQCVCVSLLLLFRSVGRTIHVT